MVSSRLVSQQQRRSPMFGEYDFFSGSASRRESTDTPLQKPGRLRVGRPFDERIFTKTFRGRGFSRKRRPGHPLGCPWRKRGNLPSRRGYLHSLSALLALRAQNKRPSSNLTRRPELVLKTNGGPRPDARRQRGEIGWHPRAHPSTGASASGGFEGNFDWPPVWRETAPPTVWPHPSCRSGSASRTTASSASFLRGPRPPSCGRRARVPEGPCTAPLTNHDGQPTPVAMRRGAFRGGQKNHAPRCPSSVNRTPWFSTRLDACPGPQYQSPTTPFPTERGDLQ